MCTFKNENMCEITYEAVRKAMGEKPYTMELVTEDAREVIEAVNRHPIDAHLEACFCPDRGDRYEEIRANGRRRLSCSVSPESLPVLLRRLFENDSCSSLGSSILTTLGFDEFGEQVGRESLGLE